MISRDEVEREIREAEEFFQCNVESQSRDHIRFLVYHANGNARHLVGMWRMGFTDGEISEIKKQSAICLDRLKNSHHRMPSGGGI